MFEKCVLVMSDIVLFYEICFSVEVSWQVFFMLVLDGLLLIIIMILFCIIFFCLIVLIVCVFEINICIWLVWWYMLFLFIIDGLIVVVLIIEFFGVMLFVGKQIVEVSFFVFVFFGGRIMLFGFMLFCLCRYWWKCVWCLDVCYYLRFLFIVWLVMVMVFRCSRLRLCRWSIIFGMLFVRKVCMVG